MCFVFFLVYSHNCAVFLALTLLNVICLCAAVSQPKRNFNTVRSPKDLTSESSISR